MDEADTLKPAKRARRARRQAVLSIVLPCCCLGALCFALFWTSGRQGVRAQARAAAALAALRSTVVGTPHAESASASKPTQPHQGLLLPASRPQLPNVQTATTMLAQPAAPSATAGATAPKAPGTAAAATAQDTKPQHTFTPPLDPTKNLARPVHKALDLRAIASHGH